MQRQQIGWTSGDIEWCEEVLELNPFSHFAALGTLACATHSSVCCLTISFLYTWKIIMLITVTDLIFCVTFLAIECISWGGWMVIVFNFTNVLSLQLMWQIVWLLSSFKLLCSVQRSFKQWVSSTFLLIFLLQFLPFTKINLYL